MGAWLDGVIAWSIERRGLVLLCAAALTVFGIASARDASLDALPDFTPPQVVVQIEAPGMSTANVEALVTRPVERALLGTPQTTRVRSMSGPGLCVVTLSFEDRTDIFRARQLVAERLQLIRDQLPSGVGQPELAPIAAPVGAVLRFCITSRSTDAAAGMRVARSFADWTLRPRLLAIEGISQVIRHGGEVERVEVQPDLARMRALGVSMAELSEAVRGSQAFTGAEFIEAEATRTEVETEVRASGPDALSQLGQTLVTRRQDTPVRVRDVAKVVQGAQPSVGAALYDGKPAVFVQVMKLPWADARRVTRDVEHALRELGATAPPGVRIEPPVFRQASFIDTSLHSIGRAMLIGSALVIAVLLAFLRHGRLALISMTAIPLSVLAALCALTALGASINAMTLGGLAIAIGECIDDAIVDVENVWRRLRENARLPLPRPALGVIRDAAREVRSSVVYATAIVGLVLIPVLLMGGVAGRIFAPLAQAYCLAIAASLVVALTVTPALCAWLLPRLSTERGELPRLSRALLGRYRGWLDRAVRQPRRVFGLALVAALGGLAILPFLGGRFLPDFHETSLIGQLNALPGTSLGETLRLAERVDAQLRPELASHIAVRAGRAELGEDPFPVHRVEMDVVLQPHDRDWEEMVQDTAERIARVAGVGFAIEGFLGERIHETLAGDAAPLVVQVLGPDLLRLRSLATQVAAIMERTPGLLRVAAEPQLDVPQLRIEPDRDALALHGVRPLDVAQSVAVYRQGQVLGEVLNAEGTRQDVVLVGAPAERTREALASLPIDTLDGGSVPLSALARVQDVFAPALIHHDGGERRIAIGADAPGGALSGAFSRLSKRLQQLPMPPGYRIELGGEAAARENAALRLLLIGGLVLLAVFALLWAAFSSAVDAGIVLLNIPLGLIGGVVGALLSSEGLSVAGLVGFVTLFGIVARNGIMVVAHKRHWDETRPELPERDRILHAAEERLLPILMTAAAAGLGLLPLALSLGMSGSELEAPMAVIVIGGLISSTVLNALVLPTVYVWLAERRQRTAVS